MPIKPNFTRADIERRFSKFLDVIENKILERLQYLGEKCVAHARQVPAGSGFTDQTGNLRSSIGYAIFKDGRAIHASYEKVKDGSDGVKAGQELAQQVAENYPKGYLLVVTAGMNYAVKLESKGKDVLTSAELLAKRELPRMVEELKDNVYKALR
ncbi:MAG TPA: hypothetical protein DHV48_12875 [Prolixibacteraceae bacterium]|nr:hypothetical protein [Prolixibacteraceae bacterium]